VLDAVTIVGASLAGFWAAETLRRDGFDGPVVLIGEEPYAPYDRPPLSKKYLAGDLDDDRLDLVSADRLADPGPRPAPRMPGHRPGGDLPDLGGGRHCRAI